MAVAAGALALLPLVGQASEPEIERIAEALVAEALASNLGLRAAEAGVIERRAALDAARARFRPALDLQLRFTRADGGREIELPLGPAQSATFRFQRSREQDSALRLTQSLYDARLPAARQAAAFGHDEARHGLQAFARELGRDVSQAWYRFLTAGEAIAILRATRELAAENRRVNASLYDNGKVTRDLVLRAEAELLEVEQRLLQAEATATLARQYVNLLCNAPLDRPLEAATIDTAELQQLAARAHPPGGAAGPAMFEEAALARRAELRQLDAGLAAAAAEERLARAAFQPQLALVLDAGTQGPDWGYREHDPYLFASLVLRFNLLSGGADRAALAAARARRAGLGASRELAGQQVRIEVHEAWSALAVAEASLQTAERRVAAAAAAWEIVARKRNLGQAPPAETLDAQRALTEARLNANVTRFAVLDALAGLNYAIGGTEVSR